MATTTTKTDKSDYVELYVDPGYLKDDPNEFVSVNGINYILPKGETSMVPPCVKYEFDRSRRAKSIQRRNSDAMLRKTTQPVEM
jgi:hypothetical protein